MLKTECSCPKLKNIEFLRIFFTLVIVIHHSLGAFNIFNLGYFAVEFFFILSGFFLIYTFKNQKDLTTFALKKIIRFMPLVLFGSLVFILINQHIAASDLLPVLFLLPSTGLSPVFYPAVGTFWYICIMFWVSIFYFYLIKTQPQSTANIIIGLLCFLSYIALNQLHQSPDWLFPRSLLRGISGMGLGYFIALAYNSYKSPIQAIPSFGRYLFYTLSEFVLLGYILYLMFVPPFLNRNCIHFVILFVLLISCFLKKKGLISQYFEDESTVKISKYCVSVFLTHKIIIDCIYPKYKNLFNLLDLSIPTYVFLFVISSIILGILSYHFIEKPAKIYLEKKIWNKN